MFVQFTGEELLPDVPQQWMATEFLEGSALDLRGRLARTCLKAGSLPFGPVAEQRRFRDGVEHGSPVF